MLWNSINYLAQDVRNNIYKQFQHKIFGIKTAFFFVTCSEIYPYINLYVYAFYFPQASTKADFMKVTDAKFM